MVSQSEIIDKFPLIFSYVKYLEHGDGWNELIHTLCKSIQSHIDHVEKYKKWAKKYWNRTGTSDNRSSLRDSGKRKTGQFKVLLPWWG